MARGDMMDATMSFAARVGGWWTASGRKSGLAIAVLGPSRFAWRIERAAPFPRVRPLRS